jgi:hypothetical protein
MEQLPGIARAGRAPESMQGSTGSSSRAARRGGQGPWTRPTLGHIARTRPQRRAIISAPAPERHRPGGVLLG